MSAFLREKAYLLPMVIVGLGVMTVASAQTSSSPFASKSKKKAWETADPAPRTPVRAAPSQHTVPQPYPSQYRGPLNAPVNIQGGDSSPKDSLNSGVHNYQAPIATPNTSVPYYYKTQNYKMSPQSQSHNNSAPQEYNGERVTNGNPAQGSVYYPSRVPPNYPQNPQVGYGYQSKPQNSYGQGYGQQAPYQRGAQPNQYQQPYQKTSWVDRFGLRNWKTALRGALRLGAAGTNRENTARNGVDRDGWNVDFIGDGYLNFEASTITSGGTEYGINLEARAQYDRFRRGFGGLAGDCSPTVEGCASVLIEGTPTSLRGHTSQFYSSGPDNAQDFEYALESAHVFLRSAYGDVTIGRDDGAAYLFSLGAPRLLAVNASNSPVDYTGLDSVKTVNDASGFAEKVTYTSPRFLGDQIGIGIQLGASYAPNARACGVDYCVRRNGVDESGALSPDLNDVLEVGLSLSRKFNNGLEVEATGTYARASEESGLDVFDDLESWNTGLEVSLADWTIGGSYLQSNNGLLNGDYTAWDAGIQWKPSRFGFNASYGHAEDENINLTSDQGVLGVTYEFDRFTLGTGIQYIERTVPVATGIVAGNEKEKATALFIEGGFTF